MLVAMILLSVTFAAVAQLTLKEGVNQVTDASGHVSLTGASIRSISSNPFVWGGLVLFGVSAALWLWVLSRASLSFAYPFAALTYLFIVLVDRFWLKEAVPPLRWAGVGMIMFGIVLVSRTG